MVILCVGNNSNIVHNIGGTTRDWHSSQINNISDIYIYDSPGILFEKQNNIFETNKIFKELLKKINVFFYVIEFNSIYNYDDYTYINYLRKYNKEIILLINKFDNFNKEPNKDYFKYGIENTFFLSCSHKYGFNKLFDYFAKLNVKKDSSIFDNDHTIAIFGKPNVGKSTFLNTLLGYERSNTHHHAGTTSDYVITDFKYKEKNIQIIDTAGIQKKSKITKNSLNYLSTKKTFDKIKKLEVAVIMIDSSEGINRQDKNIINIVTQKANNVIIIFNKIDLIKNKKSFSRENIKNITEQLNQIYNIKIFFISAFFKKEIMMILDYIFYNIFNANNEIKTSLLNKWLKRVTIRKNHPLINNKKLKLKYAVQVKSNPIIIKIFCNYANRIRKDYRRYLSNDFNKYFKILNQKTILKFSKEKNPYI